MYGSAQRKETIDDRHVSGALHQAYWHKKAIKIVGIGRFPGPTEEGPGVNWTMSNLRVPEDARKKSPLTTYLPQFARELQIEKFFAPSPIEFNGRICNQSELNISIPLGSSLSVRRGARAEGCLLYPDEGFLLSIAGCAIIVAYMDGNSCLETLNRTGVAHGGLKSFFNHKRVLIDNDSSPPKPHESVVGNLLSAINFTRERAKDTHILIAYPIEAGKLVYDWNYPGDGDQNRRMCEFFYSHLGPECFVDWDAHKTVKKFALERIAIKQCTEAGVPEENIEVISSPAYYANNGMTRWFETRGDPEFKDWRNLGIIARYT
ncbi:MAG TPA: hypothetical protein VD928_02910 [Candidatus Paceibacterota bacterium]|nr:hypothetical protein [Candidatus Paceibacterota bacterium]